MPIPPDCYRVNVVGTLGGDIEEWMFSFHLQRAHELGNPTDEQSAVDEIASKVQQKLVTNMPPHGAHFSSDVAFDHVAAYHLGTDNKTLHKGTSPFPTGTDRTGGGGDSVPWEIAFAVTLYGFDPTQFAAQARRKRGRFYLPPPGSSSFNGVHGLYSEAKQSDLSAQLATFLSDVDGMTVGGGITPDLVNLVVLSPVGGFATRVTHIGLDNKADRQARRQKKLAGRRLITALA